MYAAATDLERDIEASVKVQTSRTLTDTTRAESGTRAVAGSSVERRANEGNIILASVTGQARMILDTTKSRDAGEDRIGLGTAIARECIVPQLLVGTFLEGFLAVVAVCSNTGCQSSGSGQKLEHTGEYVSKRTIEDRR